MSDSFEFTLHSPLTKEDWNKLSDAELENTMSVTFQTPQGRRVKYIKCEVLDKIRTEIETVKSIMNDEIINHNRKDLINFVNGLDQSLMVIDKYKSESEIKDDNCAGNDQNA